MNNDIFNSNLLEELGISNLSEEEAKELLQTFSQTVMQAVIMRATIELSDEKQKEFSELLDEENEEKIGLFLKENIKNINQLIDSEAETFKKLLIKRIDSKFNN